MSLVRICCLGSLLILFVAVQENVHADDELVTWIRSYDATVATEDQRGPLARQVQNDLSWRLKQVNAQSSAEWQAIHSREEWETYRNAKMAALRKSLGAWPERNRQPEVRIVGEFEWGSFLTRNLLFESRPGWWITANLYVPDPLRESMPAILICHSHHSAKFHQELQQMGAMWAKAGCYVLVMDQLGHGERREHPFTMAADYAKPYGVGRQDYYFRYDNAIQLHIVGQSLIGWMAWEMMSAIDVLLNQKGVDAQRVILLGSVAGGGDPAAVTAALDDRITAVVPFNFGGPQPETRFPLPDDIETSFGYAGSGSWESTRNLSFSARDGFLPWTIVGSVAPRRLIYAHEFNWDQQRDPVWKRLQTIYGYYDASDCLAFTQGRGELSGKAPEASHCTHIGALHRVKIHEAFRKWFGIDVNPDAEPPKSVSSNFLTCWTLVLEKQLRPKTLSAMTTRIADELIVEFRRTVRPDTDSLRTELQRRWDKILGTPSPERLTEAVRAKSEKHDAIHTEHWMLTAESGIRVPLVVLRTDKADRDQPVVLALCSQGKDRLLRGRASDIAALITRGATVCLMDPRGIGESRLSDGHGRRSAATSHSSTALMLGTPLLGQQLKDVRLALMWLRRRSDVGFRPLIVWGESLVPANPESATFRIPRDDDDAMPAVAEPQAPLLAMLAGLFDDDLHGISASGGLVSWRSLLSSWLVLVAYDAIVPGALTAGDILDLVSGQRLETRIQLTGLIDGLNRPAGEQDLQSLRRTRPKDSFEAGHLSIIPWLNETK